METPAFKSITKQRTTEFYKKKKITNATNIISKDQSIIDLLLIYYY